MGEQKKLTSVQVTCVDVMIGEAGCKMAHFRRRGHGQVHEDTGFSCIRFLHLGGKRKQESKTRRKINARALKLELYWAELNFQDGPLLVRRFWRWI